MSAISTRYALLLATIAIASACGPITDPAGIGTPDAEPQTAASGACSNPLDMAGCPCPNAEATRVCSTGPKASLNVGTCRAGRTSFVPL